jgi:heptosyltransferase II
MKKIKPDRFKNILIRSTNWIGDAVMTTPAVRDIRKNFPHAKISMLAKPWVAPIFENSPYVDNILSYDAGARHKGFLGKFRLAGDLKAYKFDAVILLQNAFEAAFITCLAGIPNRIGYSTDGRRALLTHAAKLRPETKKKHQTKYYQEILTAFGLKVFDTTLYLEPGQKNLHRADKFLNQNSLSRDKRLLVGISPGAMYGPAKQWFPERFARLSDLIHDQYKADILIFGGPGDKQVGESISQIMRNKPINLAGKTDLGLAMALIKKCHLFITNDSGLMHVGAALDIPLIAIFGSTNPETTGPAGSRSRVIRIPIKCSPCLKPECPYKHFKCMEQINVKMVFDAVEEMWT